MAAGLRFWHLDQIPPGLYRDEAVNGLDALDVLSGNRQGESPLYFSGNNGREPAYIYLTALSIRLLGRNVEALRLAAAVIGTLTTWFVYKLAKTWFDRRVGLLSAWLWAITVWPIHLSRVGLRPILLPLMLTITFWLATLAYRRQQSQQPAYWLWLLAGALYGASFYTYLAIRFSPAVRTPLYHLSEPDRPAKNPMARIGMGYPGSGFGYRPLGLAGLGPDRINPWTPGTGIGT